MRMISIFQYDDRTMQLAKPVYDSNRRVLLSGTTAFIRNNDRYSIMVGYRAMGSGGVRNRYDEKAVIYDGAVRSGNSAALNLFQVYR